MKDSAQASLTHRQRVVLELADVRAREGEAGTYAQELLNRGVMVQSWVYKTLKKMEADGLLEAVKHPQHPRRKCYAPSTQGLEALENAKEFKTIEGLVKAPKPSPKRRKQTAVKLVHPAVEASVPAPPPRPVLSELEAENLELGASLRQMLQDGHLDELRAFIERTSSNLEGGVSDDASEASREDADREVLESEEVLAEAFTEIPLLPDDMETHDTREAAFNEVEAVILEEEEEASVHPLFGVPYPLPREPAPDSHPPQHHHRPHREGTPAHRVAHGHNPPTPVKDSPPPPSRVAAGTYSALAGGARAMIERSGHTVSDGVEALAHTAVAVAAANAGSSPVTRGTAQGAATIAGYSAGRWLMKALKEAMNSPTPPAPPWGTLFPEANAKLAAPSTPAKTAPPRSPWPSFGVMKPAVTAPISPVVPSVPKAPPRTGLPLSNPVAPQQQPYGWPQGRTFEVFNPHNGVMVGTFSVSPGQWIATPNGAGIFGQLTDGSWLYYDLEGRPHAFTPPRPGQTWEHPQSRWTTLRAH